MRLPRRTPLKRPWRTSVIRPSRTPVGPAAEPLTARFLGTALAVAACNPAAAYRTYPVLWVLVAAVAVTAWFLAPQPDVRPTAVAHRWTPAAHRRPTILAAGCVALAAATNPPVWLAACVTALLPAYLLTTDPWTSTAPGRPHRPPPGPALITAAACALVFTAAQIPVTGTTWSRLLAAATLAATTACLFLALTRRSRTPQ